MKDTDGDTAQPADVCNGAVHIHPGTLGLKQIYELMFARLNQLVQLSCFADTSSLASIFKEYYTIHNKLGLFIKILVV